MGIVVIYTNNGDSSDIYTHNKNSSHTQTMGAHQCHRVALWLRLSLYDL